MGGVGGVGGGAGSGGSGGIALGGASRALGLESSDALSSASLCSTATVELEVGETETDIVESCDRAESS